MGGSGKEERTMTQRRGIYRNGDQVIDLELHVCDCEADDLQMALQSFLVDWKRERAKQEAKKKPCGCGGESSPSTD